MTTALRLLIFLLFLNFVGFAQKPAYSTKGLKLLGVKELNDGFLLISKAKAKNTLAIQYLDTSLRERWSNTIGIPKPFGFKFNQMQVIESESEVFILCQMEKKVVVNQFGKSGTKQKPYPVQIDKDSELMRWYAVGRQLYHCHTDEAYALKQRWEIGRDLGPVDTLFSLENQFRNSSHEVLATTANGVIYGSNTVSENHGEMQLQLHKYNHDTNDTIANYQKLTLDNTSYTYNSSFDNRLFGIHQGKESFYLVGKLDLQFKKKYPTTKVGENFIGFWIAKFSNDSAELEWFSEIPFQYYDGIIPADMIKRATIIHLKEDENGGLFVVLNEIPGVVYGQRYICYLDQYGLHQTIVGGYDEYHFFEYDRQGLRNAGHKNSVRLMNDDWSSISSNIFPWLDVRQNGYSRLANQTIGLSQSNKVINEKKIYTYFYKGNQTYIFEYFKKKKGTLLIYKPSALEDKDDFIPDFK